MARGSGRDRFPPKCRWRPPVAELGVATGRANGLGPTLDREVDADGADRTFRPGLPRPTSGDKSYGPLRSCTNGPRSTEQNRQQRSRRIQGPNNRHGRAAKMCDILCRRPTTVSGQFEVLRRFETPPKRGRLRVDLGERAQQCVTRGGWLEGNRHIRFQKVSTFYLNKVATCGGHSNRPDGHVQ